MTIPIDQLVSTATPDDFFAEMMAAATTLQLPTTSWQEGDPERTILRVLSQMLGVAAGTAINSQGQYVDGLAANIAMGGFLDYAATVTTDPSIDPTATGGWLDLLASSVYAVTRNPPSRGVSTVSLNNTSANTYGPFAVGTYHIRDSGTGATFSNAASLTIPPGGVTGVQFLTDTNSPALTGTPNTTVTALVGVTISSATTATMTPAQSNASLVAQCRAKLATFASKTGPTSAYTYYATATAETGYPTLVAPITRALPVADRVNGSVTVYLADASGAPAGGDVTAMQTYLQGVCTPDDTTMACAACATSAVSMVCTIYAPTDVSAAVQSAYVAFINSLPIGGLATENGGVTGVSLNQAEDYIARAVPSLRLIQITNLGGGGATSFALAFNAIATASTGSVTVTYGGT